MNEELKQKITRSITDLPIELSRFYRRQYPAFVSAQAPAPLQHEVPVFMFHRVQPETFEEQLAFLQHNHYHTLSLPEFMAYLGGRADLKGPSVLLTFDDGEKSLYQVAYPLLQQYGFQAAAFVIPHFVLQRPDRTSQKAMISWNELVEIEKSGVIDIQSHSYYHDLIFSGPNLVDFYHPLFDSNPLGIDLPWIDEGDQYTNRLKWGTPIYATSSRFSGRLRYLDSPVVRSVCTTWVAGQGGESYFNQPGWRKELNQVFQAAARSQEASFETAQERRTAIFSDLCKSRAVLEERLGKPVRHLCLPRGVGSHLCTQLSKAAGYESIFWVTRPGQRANTPGTSPFAICRVKDDYLLRLPGQGRKPLLDIFTAKLHRRAETLDLY